MGKIKVESIIQAIRDKGLTAYEISKHVPLTEDGINKILSGHSKNPRQSTLQVLHDYLNGNVKHEKAPPDQVRLEDLISKSLIEELKPYLKDFEQGHISTGRQVHDLTELVKSLAARIVKMQFKLESIEKKVGDVHEVVTPTK